MWPVCEACTVGLFENLITLMLTCAQSGRVSGLVKKTDPASSSRSGKKGHKDNNNRLLGIVNTFCIPFRTKSKILPCWGLDSDCTVVTFHRTTNFRVMHIPVYRGIELNLFDSVDSSIRRGPNSMVFGKFFQLERFRLGFFALH